MLVAAAAGGKIRVVYIGLAGHRRMAVQAGTATAGGWGKILIQRMGIPRLVAAAVWYTNKHLVLAALGKF